MASTTGWGAGARAIPPVNVTVTHALLLAASPPPPPPLTSPCLPTVPGLLPAWEVGGQWSPQNGGGSGLIRKRAQLTGPLISCSVNQSVRTLAPKALKIFLIIENGQFFFSTNPWQKMTFLNPLDALIPKISLSFLQTLGSESPPGPGFQSR